MTTLASTSSTAARQPINTAREVGRDACQTVEQAASNDMAVALGSPEIELVHALREEIKYLDNRIKTLQEDRTHLQELERQAAARVPTYLPSEN